MQRIISLTMGISNFRWHNELHIEFHKDVSMWLVFLENWNGVSIFFGDTVLHTSELQLFTDTPGSLGYDWYLNGNGFKATGSLSTALTLLLGSDFFDIVNTIQSNMDKSLFTCGFFIDLKKAFDTVDHAILLDKLNHYGFRGIVKNWFSS